MLDVSNIINFITQVSTFSVIVCTIEEAKTLNLQADVMAETLIECDNLALGELLQEASNGLCERICKLKPSWA